jgi:serine/threonine protein kinase
MRKRDEQSMPYTMNLELWQKIDGLLQATLALEPEQRASFLDDACAGHQSLRTEVELLLAADAMEWELIDRPALEVAASLLALEQPQLEAGKQVGRYQIIELLGRGGMGEVYLAEDDKLHRKVALKLLLTDAAKDLGRLRRFQHEALAVSTLNHPNIITIYETGEFEDRQFIVTEFVDGETLRQRMRRSRLSVQEALNIALQITGALAAAHQGGIVHRDMKPENVMIRADGYVKILDFGLAKLSMLSTFEELAIAHTQGYTQAGLILGTTRYMSPEQARGLALDARTDLWSAGVILYEMLSDELPFSGCTNSDVIVSILTSKPTRLIAASTRLTDELQTILDRGLSKDSVARYQSALEMHADLESALDFAARVESQLARLATPLDFAVRKKTRLPRLTAAVLLLALLSTLGVVIYRRIRRSNLDLSPITAENFQRRGGVSRWSGDGDGNDSGGMGNHLTLHNGAHFADGKIGQGIAFDGGEDYAQAPTNGFPTGNADRTLEMWAKLDALVVEENFLGGYGAFGSYSQTYTLSAGGTTLMFSQWGDAVSGRFHKLEMGRWYHIAVTNELESVALYLDGAIIQTGDAPINTPVGTPFIIGWVGPAFGEIRRLKGAVDEVRVYNRALAPEEIAANYAASR